MGLHRMGPVVHITRSRPISLLSLHFKTERISSLASLSILFSSSSSSSSPPPPLPSSLNGYLLSPQPHNSEEGSLDVRQWKHHQRSKLPRILPRRRSFTLLPPSPPSQRLPHLHPLPLHPPPSQAFPSISYHFLYHCKSLNPQCVILIKLLFHCLSLYYIWY